MFTAFIWGLFFLALYLDPVTCYPELCTPTEGHDSILLSSDTRLPILSRHVANDAVMIDYVSLERRELKALCSEADQVMEAVINDPRNADAQRIMLGSTTPYGVDWKVDRFIPCCTTTYFTLVRNTGEEWHLRPCDVFKQ